MPIANSGIMLKAVNGAATNVPVEKNDDIAANAIPVDKKLLSSLSYSLLYRFSLFP